MKRKELYNYIREEIISELTINEELIIYTPDGTAKSQNSSQKAEAAAAVKKTPPVSVRFAKVGDISAVQKENMEEDKLEEANKANNLKVDNQEKFTAAKNLYSNSWIGELLNAVEEAGEEGISIKSLTEKVGKKASANINPLIQELKSIGAIASTRITGEPEVVEPEVEEPETTTPESDFFITDTDDEDKEEEEKEPTDSDEDEDNKAYKGAKKVDDEETKKSDEKIKVINDAVAIVKKKVGRIKDIKKKNPKNYKNTNEYIEQMEKLKQFIQKNRSILTKAGTIKNLTDELIS